jgi:hypothetical protein
MYLELLGVEQMSTLARADASGVDGSLYEVRAAFDTKLNALSNGQLMRNRTAEQQAVSSSKSSSSGVELHHPSGRILLYSTAESSGSSSEESDSRNDNVIVNNMRRRPVGHRLRATEVNNVVVAQEALEVIPDLLVDHMGPSTSSPPLTPTPPTTDYDQDYELQALMSDAEQTSSSQQLPALPTANTSEWQLQLRAGLIEMLAVVMVTSSDALAARAVDSGVVRWEPLIAMLNHQPTPAVRDACMRALCALLMRAADTHRVRFMRAHGFALLGNQLREYPCTPAMGDCLFSVLCGESVRLEDG